MPRLFMATKMENRFPVIDILDQTPEIPDTAAWAIFLRNHDELTLEMVTDEERDYMYRVYAEDPQARINQGIRRRLAPLLRNDRRQIELMNALLLSLPGTPVLYYGDEIGMGDNIYLGDRNGVRTPMQWSPDRNAGFSRANPQRLYLPVITDPEYHYEALNVEAQQANSSSLWWWMKQMIAQRKALPALSGGDLRFLTPDNPKVLAFERTLGDETVLVVANLSKRPQAVEIDLSHHEGINPVEIFGQTDFPTVGELPYFLTPGPYQFYWFRLSHEEPPAYALPRVRVRADVDADTVFRARTQLSRALATDLPHRRWFRSKAHTIRQVDIVDVIPISSQGPRLVVATVEYTDQDPETYILPLSLARGEEAEWIVTHEPERIVAEVSGPEESSALVLDAMGDERVASTLLDLTRRRRRRLRGTKMELAGKGDGRKAEPVAGPITIVGTEQSNTSVVFGEELILKLFRKLEWGENPDIEISRYLTEQGEFEAIAPVRGVVDGRMDGDSVSVAVVQTYVANQGDAWSYAVDLVGNFVDQVAAMLETGKVKPGRPRHPLDLIGSEAPESLADLVNLALPSAERLGQRTGEMHRALGAATEDPAFSPEQMTTLYQRSLYQAMRSAVRENFALLRRRRSTLDEDTAALANEVLELEGEILDRLRQISTEKITASRSRIHGDYHLGQVLFTGNDFVIIDFEGEPLRPLSERRIKRSPLRDVAGMIRSYHYVARAGLLKRVEEGVIGRDTGEMASLEPWVDAWFQWTAASFLEAYLTEVKGTAILPPEESHIRVLLDAYLLEKAVYELGYELNNRPDWVPIALAGIRLHLA
jgi:maltose alpha-D-glucosyltransferase/alpha-amylase